LTSQLLGYRETVVRQALLSRTRRKRQTSGDQERPGASSQLSDPEASVVALLMSYPLGYAVRSGTTDLLEDGIFRDIRNREIVSTLRKAGFDVGEAAANWEPGLASYAASLQSSVLVRDDLSPGMANNEILQALDRLRRHRYQEMVQQTQSDIRDARESGDGELLRSSLQRMSELAQEKANYDPKVSPYFRDLRTSAT
jgi:hypothetical protein